MAHTSCATLYSAIRYRPRPDPRDPPDPRGVKPRDGGVEAEDPPPDAAGGAAGGGGVDDDGIVTVRFARPCMASLFFPRPLLSFSSPTTFSAVSLSFC